MKFGLKFVIATALVSLAIGCGGTDDPSKNNGNNGETNNGQTSNNGQATNNGVDPNNGQTTNNGVDPNNGQTTNNGVDPNNGQTTNNGQPATCDPNTVFFGQIGGDDDHGGGVPSTDPLTVDAGLGAIDAAYAATEEMPQTIDLPVTGAIVTATNFGTGGNSNFWIQDANAAFQVFLGFDNPVDVTVKVGDAVSFQATGLGNFDGNPQITSLTGFTVDSSGNPVPYMDKTGQDLVASDYYKIVRITGTLGDTATDCGGSSKCYDIVNGTQTIVYRSSSEFTEPGDCVTYVGPAGMFPGPKADSGTMGTWQLDVRNFDWSFTQFD